MKKILKNKIINIENTDLFDNKFLFEYLTPPPNPLLSKEGKLKGVVEIIHISDLLELKKNEELLKKVKEKPAMYSNVYSPEDELEIFKELFDNAIQNNKKIHIVGITLDEEIKILEKYYEELGFMREDINCFEVDFSVPLVTASVKIENLMWKGSDYKAQRSNIFFNPPIRESGQVKSMFKGINRGVTAGIYLSELTEDVEVFLGNCIGEEKILSLILGKVLNFNLSKIGFIGERKELIISY